MIEPYTKNIQEYPKFLKNHKKRDFKMRSILLRLVASSSFPFILGDISVYFERHFRLF